MDAHIIGRKQFALAAALAVLLEFLLLLLVAWWLLLGRNQALDADPDSDASVTEQETEKVLPDPTKPPESVVLQVLPPPAKLPEKLVFQVVETAPKQNAKPTRPTALISENSSQAASQVSRQDPSLPAQPTIEGIQQPGFDLQDQAFRDGADNAGAGNGDPGPSGPVVMDSPSRETPQDQALVKMEENRENEKSEKSANTPPAGTDVPPMPEPSPRVGDVALLELPGTLPRIRVPKPAELLPPRPDAQADPEARKIEAMLPVRPPAGGGGGTQGLQSAKLRRALEGTLSQNGEAALDVEDTPLGRYLSRVSRVIERDWQNACRTHRDLITPGFLRITFTVDARGKVLSAKPVEVRDGAAASTAFTLNSVKMARLPPIPEDIIEMLDNEQLEINFNFLFFQ